MSVIHPHEMELACAGDGESSAALAGHLGRCARCRNVAADYRWLENNLAVTLATAAQAVTVPHPAWRAVRERLSAGQQRLVAGRRLSVVAGIALAACIMLVASPALGMAIGAQTLLPRVAMAPALATALTSDGAWVSTMTPTPAPLSEEAGSPLASLSLPPTQPKPDAMYP